MSSYIQIEGLTFDGSDKRFTLTQRSGWDITPGITGSNLVIPGRDGEVWRAKKYAPSRMVLDIFIHNVNASGTRAAGVTADEQYRLNLDTLFSLFSRRTGLITVNKFDGDYATAAQRTNYAEVTAVLNPDFAGSSTDPNSQMTVELTFPNPIWEDIVAQASTFTSVTNGGQYTLSGALGYITAPITDAVILLIGPATNPRIVDGASDSFIQYNGTLTSGQRWRVNCQTFQSEIGSNLQFNTGGYTNINSGTNVIASTSYGPDANLFTIAPNGTSLPSVLVYGSGFSSTQLTITAKRKFIA